MIKSYNPKDSKFNINTRNRVVSTNVKTKNNKSQPNNLLSPRLHYPLSNSLIPEIGSGYLDYTRTTTGSNATYIDKNGILKTAANDEPRFEKGGLLMETSSTNLLKQSNTFSDLIWGNPTPYHITYTPSADTGPDNIIGSAWRVTEDSASGFSHTIMQNSVSNPALVHTASVYLKIPETNYRRYMSLLIWNAGVSSNAVYGVFDILEGKIVRTGNNNSGRNVRAQIIKAANGYWRCCVSGIPHYDTTTGASTGIGGYFLVDPFGSTVYTGDGVSGFYISSCQLEQSAFPTSYIPTDSSARTRGTDSFNIYGNNNFIWPDSPQTIICEGDHEIATSFAQYFYTTSGVNFSNIVASMPNGTMHSHIENSSGVYTSFITKPKIKIILCAVKRKNKLELWYNGIMVASKGPSGLASGTFNYMMIAPYLNGHVKNLKIYDYDLSELEIKKLTSL